MKISVNRLAINAAAALVLLASAPAFAHGGMGHMGGHMGGNTGFTSHQTGKTNLGANTMSTNNGLLFGSGGAGGNTGTNNSGLLNTGGAGGAGGNGGLFNGGNGGAGGNTGPNNGGFLNGAGGAGGK